MTKMERTPGDERKRPVGGKAKGKCRVCKGPRIWVLAPKSKNLHGCKAQCPRCEGMRILLKEVKNRAKEKGVPYDIPHWKKLPPEPSHCPECNREMKRGGERADQPELDRRVPDLGYVLSNVMWICGDCNARKFNISLDDWEAKKRGR